MSDELLRNENKFYELNLELEKKAKELMKEVNSVVNTGINFDREDSNSNSNNSGTKKNVEMNKLAKNSTISKYYGSSSSSITSFSDSKMKNLQSDNNLSRYLTRSNKSLDKEIIFEDENLIAIKNDDVENDEKIFEKQCNNSVKNDAVIRFFKSKSKILETELEAIRIEYKKKCDYSSDLQVENKKLDEERMKFYNQLTTIKDNFSKIEGINKTQLLNLQRTENENIALKKEIEALKKELKIYNQNCSSYGIRLNRSLEDNERLRKSLKCSQLDEKELREDIRKLEEDKKSVITNFEKQRSELIHAFKKQILLVDNLKRQKAHLEASILIKYTEEELLKLLDWKLDEV